MKPHVTTAIFEGPITAGCKVRPKQEQSIRRILRFFYQNCITPENYAIEYEATELTSKTLSLTVRVERIDCEVGSLRHVLCGDGGHFFIRVRGAIEVCNTYAVASEAHPEIEHRKYVAQMVRGSIR